MRRKIQIPGEVAKVFDSMDYNNQRGLLLQAKDVREAREKYPCPYDNTKLCQVCGYLQKYTTKAIEDAIRKLTTMGEKTKLAELIN